MGNLADRRKTGLGLKRLRNRFVTRARYLTSDPHFQQSLAADVAEWNRRFPHFRFSQSIAPEDIQPDKTRYPPRLHDVVLSFPPIPVIPLDKPLLDALYETDWPRVDEDAHVAPEAWKELLDKRSREFWPPMDFPHPSRATAFVSACLLFDPRTLAGKEERFFSTFSVQAEHFPEDPERAFDAAYRAESAEAARDVLSAALTELLANDPDKLRQIKTEAKRAASEAVKERVLSLLRTPPRKWWYYLPLDEGFSAKDLKAVSSALARISEEFERVHLCDRIHALRADGMPITRIANALGVSDETVHDVLTEPAS